MRVIEGIKESLGVTPGQMVFNVLVKVLFDCVRGLFVITLQGEEIVAALLPNLARDSCLAAHGIDRDHTAFDGQQVQEVRNRRDLIGFAVGFQLANDEPTTL